MKLLRSLKLKLLPEYTIALRTNNDGIDSNKLYTLIKLYGLIHSNVDGLKDKSLSMNHNIYHQHFVEAGIASGHIHVEHTSIDKYYFISPSFINELHNYQMVRLVA